MFFTVTVTVTKHECCSWSQLETYCYTEVYNTLVPLFILENAGKFGLSHTYQDTRSTNAAYAIRFKDLCLEQ